MKTKLFLLGALTLLVAACQDELQQPVNQAMVGDLTPLSIQVVANPATKGVGKVSGTMLPSNSYIGLFLFDGNGDGNYDGINYKNRKALTVDGINWQFSPSDIMLSATEGTLYAYYPYDYYTYDLKAVGLKATSNTDYMFATSRSGVSNSNPDVVLTMNHALSLINFVIKKAAINGYSGTGEITNVKIEGETVAAEGTMDITNNGYISATPAPVFYSTDLSLTGTNSGEVFAVPTGTTSSVKFSVLMDGQVFTATTEPVKLLQGHQYTYSLTMYNKGMTISQVTVNEWQEVSLVDVNTDMSVASTIKCTQYGDNLYSVFVNGSLVLDRINFDSTFECSPDDVIKISFNYESPNNTVKVDGNQLTISDQQNVTFTATKQAHRLEIQCGEMPDIPEIV